MCLDLPTEELWRLLSRERDGETRVRVARALRERTPVPAAMTEALLSRDSEVRRLVVWIASSLSWDAAAPILQKGADDAAARVRLTAVVALAPFKEEGSVALLGGACADPDTDIAVAAANALMGCGARAVAPLLKAAGDRRGAVKAAALRSLAALRPLGDAGVLTAATGALRHPDAEVRAVACQLVGAVGGPPEVAALEPCLGDPDEAVRRRAEAARADLLASPSDQED